MNDLVKCYSRCISSSLEFQVVSCLLLTVLSMTFVSAFSRCPQPFTSCCIGSAGHRTAITTITSPTLTPQPLTPTELSFPSYPTPALVRSYSIPATSSRRSSPTSPISPEPSDPPVQTFPAGLQDTQWGTPTSLDGLLGTAFVCHEALQPPQLLALHTAGKPPLPTQCARFLPAADRPTQTTFWKQQNFLFVCYNFLLLVSNRPQQRPPLQA